MSGAQSLRTIDVFEGSWGSLGSPGGDLGGSSGGLGGVYGWFSGVLGILGGRGGVLGGSTGRSGRLGRASKNVHFHFCWEVNLLTVLSETAFFEIDRLRGDEVWALCCATFLSFFEACFLGNSEVNML